MLFFSGRRRHTRLRRDWSSDVCSSDLGGPAVHKLAAETLKETYTGYAGVKTAPGGQDISSTFDSHLEFIASSLADVPGGLDVLFEVVRQRYPQEILPYKEFFLNADPAQFGPKLKKAIQQIGRAHV